jgi:hypothetical protein
VRKRVANTCAALNIKRRRHTSIPNARGGFAGAGRRHTHSLCTRARPLFIRRRTKVFVLLLLVSQKRHESLRLRKFRPGKWKNVSRCGFGQHVVLRCCPLFRFCSERPPGDSSFGGTANNGNFQLSLLSAAAGEPLKVCSAVKHGTKCSI